VHTSRFYSTQPRTLARGRAKGVVFVAASAASGSEIEADGSLSKGLCSSPQQALRDPSGLVSMVLKDGQPDGTPPAVRDTVTVHYTGWRAADGKPFDSTEGDEPCTFEADSIMQGWTKGLQLMTVGEKRRFWIPSSLAYGDSPGGGRPAGALIFDIELTDVERSSATLKPKMGGFRQPKGNSASRSFKSPWRFLDNFIP